MNASMSAGRNRYAGRVPVPTLTNGISPPFTKARSWRGHTLRRVAASTRRSGVSASGRLICAPRQWGSAVERRVKLGNDIEAAAAGLARLRQKPVVAHLAEFVFPRRRNKRPRRHLGGWQGEVRVEAVIWTWRIRYRRRCRVNGSRSLTPIRFCLDQKRRLIDPMGSIAPNCRALQVISGRNYHKISKRSDRIAILHNFAHVFARRLTMARAKLLETERRPVDKRKTPCRFIRARAASYGFWFNRFLNALADNACRRRAKWRRA